MSKIVYSNRPLKKGERRATMKEAVDKNRICYWGTNVADPEMIEKKKEEVKERRKIGRQVSSCPKRLVNLEKRISNAKTEKTKEKLEEKLNELREMCNALMKQHSNMAMKKIKKVTEKINSKSAAAEKSAKESTEKEMKLLEEEINKVEQKLKERLSELNKAEQKLEEKLSEIKETQNELEKARQQKEYIEDVPKSRSEQIEEDDESGEIPSHLKVRYAKYVDEAPKFDVKTCLGKSSKKLQEHQAKFVESFLNNKYSRGAIVIHGIGSGKTLTAVALSRCYLAQYPDSKVIVITPASLQENFKQELYDYSPEVKDDKRYHFYTFESYAKSKETCDDALLIVDEAHNLRNTKGKKFSVIRKQCARNARKVCLLTATPIINSESDIVALMKLIDRRFTLNAKEFAVAITSKSGIERIFDCKLSLFFPDEAAKEANFPKVYHAASIFTMTPTYFKEYQKVEKNQLDEELNKKLAKNPKNSKKKKSEDDDEDDENSNIAAFYNGVRRAANSLEAENGPKINYMVNLIKNGYSDEDDLKKFNKKFVVFSHFLDAGSRLLTKRLDQEKIPYGEITGSVSKAKRAKIVNDYVNDKLNVVIISKAGAEGLNLKNTGHLIIMEPAWNESTIEQVIGRAVRYKGHESSPKEKRNVKIHKLLLVKPSESERINEIMEKGEPQKNMSIDLYLHLFSEKKQERLNEFLEKIKGYVRRVEDKRCQKS